MLRGLLVDAWWMLRQTSSAGRRELGVPDRIALEPARLAWLFRQLGPDYAPMMGSDLTAAAEGARHVAFVLERGRASSAWTHQAWLEVDGVRVTIGYGELDLWCRDCGFRPCQHLFAVILAVLHVSDQARPLLERPLWELLLLPTTDAEPPAERRPASDRTPGWIRYHIHWPLRPMPSAAWDTRPDPRGLVSRELVRTSRRDGRPLKPQNVPREWDAAEAKVSGLEPHDKQIHEALERLESFLEAGRTSSRVRIEALTARLIDDTLAEIVHLLARASDVRFAGEPIQVLPDPVSPRIASHADLDGTLRLTWEPPVAKHLDLGPGFVLTPAPEPGAPPALRRLDPRFPRAMRHLLDNPLPDVPPGDVDRFISRFVLRAPVAMTLADGPTPGVADADAVEPRLVLSEQADALLVDARFAYRLGPGVAEVGASDRTPLLSVSGASDGTSALVRRDPDREAVALARLRPHLGDETPARLEGLDAYDFLVETLPRLSETWDVFGEDSLKFHRVRGTAAASVSVKADVDWFDVQVTFKAGKADLKLGDVLASWVEGKRYHRLADGSVARLPERWLARHGHALSELEELRKAGKGRLGGYALPLAEAFLEGTAHAPELEPWRRLAAELRDFQAVPELPIPPTVRADLRDYQRAGFRWLCWLRDARLGGLLADDMGLGKTLQTLAALADTHLAPDGSPRPVPPSLVVAPASVVHNWALEARRFVPDLEIHVHHGPSRADVIPEDAQLVVTSYALLRLDAELLSQRGLTWLILDEAQAIKNPQSQAAKVARAMPAAHRLALTGTPLENNLFELWSLVHFVMPGFFGSHRAFAARYAHPIHKLQDTDALDALRARLRPFVLRRLKEEVALELPPRQEQVLYCDLGEAQRKLYDQVKATWRTSVLGSVREHGVGKSTIHVLEALTRLRQAACDPRLLPFEEARQVGESAKLDLVMDTLTEIAAARHRALVFSQWPSLLSLLAERLNEAGLPWLMLDGSTRDRGALVERFQAADGPPIFLISLKAGGTGLNLTAADHVLHLDPWWNPAAEDQATDRAHRIGQTKPVVAYKIVARDTVEEKILELQDRKRALFEAAVDAERLVVDALTREDLEAVFA